MPSLSTCKCKQRCFISQDKMIHTNEHWCGNDCLGNIQVGVRDVIGMSSNHCLMTIMDCEVFIEVLIYTCIDTKGLKWQWCACWFTPTLSSQYPTSVHWFKTWTWTRLQWMTRVSKHTTLCLNNIIEPQMLPVATSSSY